MVNSENDLVDILQRPAELLMFKVILQKTGKSSITVQEIRPKTFKTMAQYVYTDDLKLDSITHALTVYEASDQYDLQLLGKLTEEYINTNIKAEDALEVFEFAENHPTLDVRAICVQLIETKTKDIVESDKFLSSTVKGLEALVNSECLSISEVELFKYIEKWAENTARIDGVPVNSLRPSLDDIIKKIRFLSMSLRDFVRIPYRSQLLTAEEKNSILMNISIRESEPLPQGFTNSDQPRCADTFSYLYPRILVNWRKCKISEVLFGEKYLSPTFTVGRHPFRICFKPNTEGENKQLGLFLQCDSTVETHGENWNCKVVETFTIRRKQGQPRMGSASDHFQNSAANFWGWNDFLEWSEFINEGYVENNAVDIELDLRLTSTS